MMKRNRALFWVGIAFSLTAVSCSKSPAGFCESWVEDTCEAVSGCCHDGAKFDKEGCKLTLSAQCLQSVKIEKVESGEVDFHSGAASDCFGTIEKCSDLFADTSDDFERRAACGNMITGARPTGA